MPGPEQRGEREGGVGIATCEPLTPDQNALALHRDVSDHMKRRVFATTITGPALQRGRAAPAGSRRYTATRALRRARYAVTTACPRKSTESTRPRAMSLAT